MCDTIHVVLVSYNISNNKLNPGLKLFIIYFYYGHDIY